MCVPALSPICSRGVGTMGIQHPQSPHTHPTTDIASNSSRDKVKSN